MESKERSQRNIDTVPSIPSAQLLSAAGRGRGLPTVRIQYDDRAPTPATPSVPLDAPLSVSASAARHSDTVESLQPPDSSPATSCPCGAAHPALCPSCGPSRLAAYEREAGFLERGFPGLELGELLELLSDITDDLAIVRGPARRLWSADRTWFDRANRLEAAAAAVSRWVRRFYSPRPQSPVPHPPLSDVRPEGTGVARCPTVTFRTDGRGDCPD